MLVTVFVSQAVFPKDRTPLVNISETTPPSQASLHLLSSFSDILCLTPAQVGTRDLATLNLLCAQDLSTAKPNH